MLSIIPVMQLLSCLGEVKGRKHLQKLVYILQNSGVPFEERFEYSFYGVYSESLQSKVMELCKNKMVKESQKGNSFSIKAESALKGLLRDCELNSQQTWFVLAKELNNYPTKKLEGISTIMFLQSMEMLTGKAAIKQRLVELKPHLADIAEECWDEFHALPNTRSTEKAL